MADELSARAREVLRAVIQEHIQTGEPVGSQQLARTAEFDVSSATLRSVLSDLEALGLIDKPHTSAGRVPTDRGYRFYVDSLVRLREPGHRERELIQSNLARETGVEERLAETGRLLHALTRHAVVVLTPRPAAAIIERVEFLRLREDRVLAVLVSRDAQVLNKVITVDFPVTSEELIRAGNYLSALLREVSLEEARGRIQQELEQERADYDVLARKALTLGEVVTDIETAEKVLIEGTDSFLEAKDADLGAHAGALPCAGGEAAAARAPRSRAARAGAADLHRHGERLLGGGRRLGDRHPLHQRGERGRRGGGHRSHAHELPAGDPAGELHRPGAQPRAAALRSRRGRELRPSRVELPEPPTGAAGHYRAGGLRPPAPAH